MQGHTPNMLVCNRLVSALAVVAVLIATGLPAPARTRKGEKFLKEGKQAEVKKDWDAALELYEQALAEDPADPAYVMAAQRVRFQAGQMHLDKGKKLRNEGNLEEAAREFQKAVATDPSSTLALQELNRTLGLIERQKKQAEEGKQPEKVKSPQEEAQERMDKMIESIQPVPELKPAGRRITSLKMNNQPVRVLFETLGKLGGLNVIFDPEFQNPTRNFSVDLANINIAEGLDYLGVLTKSYWKPLSANTIFVTNENPTKRRDYEDYVVKAFYIKNVTTPQELQEVANVLRSLADIRRVFPYPSQNAIMVRGSVDQVRLAEKLVQDMDKPRAEVVVDVYVIEANRTRTRELAATFVSGGTNGLSIPVSFTPRAILSRPGVNGSDNGASDGDGTNGDTGGGSQTGSILVSNLGKLTGKDFSITLPNAIFKALMSDRGTRLMLSPQVRAADGAKSSLKIGDRYPYATGSFQPGVGTVGISPLVSTQFQFADVGVNVDITPKIHGADEVSMQVDIDISNIRDRIDVGGLSQPVIGQRKLSHAVRLREGEVSVLGGLMSDLDTRNRSGTAGLADVPVLKYLFSGDSREKTDSELLIALIPHIVRYQDVTPTNIKQVAAGSDTLVKLSYSAGAEDEKPGAKPEEVKPAPPPLAPAKPPIPVPGMPGAAPAPQPEEPKPQAPAEPPAAAPAPPAAGLPAAPPPEAGTPKPETAGLAAPATKVLFLPEQVQAQLSGAVIVTLEVDGAADLAGAPFRVKWDPKVLRLNEIVRGALFAEGGQQPIYTRNILNDTGDASVNLSRLPGSPGVNGRGSLVVFTFQAVGKGTTQVRLPELNLRNSQMQAIAASPPVLTVTVQ